MTRSPVRTRGSPKISILQRGSMLHDARGPHHRRGPALGNVSPFQGLVAPYRRIQGLVPPGYSLSPFQGLAALPHSDQGLVPPGYSLSPFQGDPDAEPVGRTSRAI